MCKLSELPNYALAFKKMKILIDLRNEVEGNKTNTLAISILGALNNPKMSTDKILAFIKDSANQSLKTMQETIGNDLTELILSL